MSVMVTINVALPGSLSLDDRDDLVTAVRETGSAELLNTGRTLLVSWEAESEWELRGLVQGAINEVYANFDVRLYHDLDALVPVPVKS